MLTLLVIRNLETLECLEKITDSIWCKWIIDGKFNVQTLERVETLPEESCVRRRTLLRIQNETNMPLSSKIKSDSQLIIMPIKTNHSHQLVPYMLSMLIKYVSIKLPFFHCQKSFISLDYAVIFLFVNLYHICMCLLTSGTIYQQYLLI